MIDLKAIIASWYRGKDARFETPMTTQQVFSPYDIPDALIQDMISRNVRPFSVQTIDLTNAGSMKIQTPGFHFVIYGHNNTPNKAVNTTAYVEVWWGNTKNAAKGFPAKHARGFSGIFSELFIEWPAQIGVFADIVVLTGMNEPWIDGESCT